MKIIPAIDIIEGKCVRLTQGDFGQMKVYRKNPAEVALEFQDVGMEYLHLVDLDGAKKGKVVNWKVIEEIQDKTVLTIDFGGGVKTDEEVEHLLNLGINQINVGSLAVQEPKKFIGWLHKYGPDNFILSADVKNENIMINGWQESVNFRLFNLVIEFINQGLEYLTCTDIGSDGMLQGPNIGLYKKLKQRFPSLKINASGGVSSADDIKALNFLNLHGVIIGKAIYEGRINLAELKKN
ncbi:MAG: Phosphoribosylformimino-5-aminoimidazole carboxamide ribotide isomerase [Cytophagales bacterium]|nr:1-(5-phosphoribosyl)-5-[(5-phosphoribosylamino)methylideneamino]imidazole-4-carboxamide isomerase [Bacteroidota bacterium]MBS1981648.1 1-(5-phosphoribosyl)-5-[(5-phosphoribosylamino)methylideneamino]imidazole-4-carboxamide isomerase [Bacteroidota bacterium]WHZ08958.1 MAG: Phosphoribosylformimino-5-aminoimidazole carboxamide ribotide isomerase [Cytophagales bacterium]